MPCDAPFMSYIVCKHKNKSKAILHLSERKNSGTEWELPEMSGSTEKCLHSKEVDVQCGRRPCWNHLWCIFCICLELSGGLQCALHNFPSFFFLTFSPCIPNGIVISCEIQRECPSGLWMPFCIKLGAGHQQVRWATPNIDLNIPVH